MSDDRIQALSRLTIAVAALSYIVVFLAALLGGAVVEMALLKAMAAMLCLGLLGWVALALVDSSGVGEEANSHREAPRRLNVALSATPDEVVGERQ